MAKNFWVHKDKKDKDKDKKSKDKPDEKHEEEHVVVPDQTLSPIANTLRQSLSVSGEDGRAAVKTLVDSLMTVDDVVNLAVSLNQTYPLSASRRGERHIIENEALTSFKAVLLERINKERQNAAKAQQTARISGLDRCAHALELETKIPRDLLHASGKVDNGLENLVIKLEIRGLLYELASLMTVVKAGEECASLTLKANIIEERLKIAESERKKAEQDRKKAEVDRDNALMFAEANKDVLSQDGLIMVRVEGTDRMIVKGGTVVKLIDRLFSLSIDKDYIYMFLVSYRSFTDPQTLLHATIQKFNEAKETPEELASTSMMDRQKVKQKQMTRLRVGSFLKDWLQRSPHDFEQDSALLDELKQFIAENSKEMKIQESLLNKLHEDRHHEFSSRPPEAIEDFDTVSFMTISDLELARQLTYYEYHLLCKIRLYELLSCGWAKKDKEKRSPNLLKMIDHFNNVTSYVSFIICSERDLRRRAAIVRKVLRVIEEAQKLNNFFAVFELSAGLNCSAVNRLKLTWEEVSKDRGTAPEKVMALTSPQSNFSAYRTALRNAAVPVIPYLGQYLSDLTFIEDGNSDTLENGYVNFEKCTMVANAILNMKQFQDSPYNLAPIERVQQWISTWESKTEKEIFDLSLIAEPRAPRPQP